MLHKARQSLQCLIEGNERFVAANSQNQTKLSTARRHDLLKGQEPIAIILGCSDSRAPAELIFDQGLGDLFVIRVAGNVVAPSQIASIEFAAEQFGTPLVVVMGHSQCGAVTATIEALKSPQTKANSHVHSIVGRISPAVAPLLHTNLADNPALLLEQATKANIRASTNQLRHGSSVLEKLINDKQLLIVGAEYSLETGKVDFFDLPDNQ